MYSEYILYITSPLSLLILTAYIVYDIYGKHYVQKKAENLATKEDIEAITRIVEEVKLAQNKQLEDHKTENLLRMVALDKRLEVHQAAYTLWSDTMKQVRRHEFTSEVVNIWQDFWSENCLYLDEMPSKSFSEALSSYSKLLSHKNLKIKEGVYKQHIRKITLLGEAIEHYARPRPMNQTENILSLIDEEEKQPEMTVYVPKGVELKVKRVGDDESA